MFAAYIALAKISRHWASLKNKLERLPHKHFQASIMFAALIINMDKPFK
jgi:hypothetical protein